jgi:DNA-binding LytR/AlgR family response regulator
MFRSLLNRPYPFYNEFKFNLQSVSGITLGLFLFLLFFQPLDPPVADFNKKLLILSGLALITLFFLSLCRIILPSVLPHFIEKWSIKKEIILHLAFLVFNTVAYVFFARYVGQIEITFHLVVNIFMISLALTTALIIINEYKFLKKKVQSLMNQYGNFDINENNDSIDTGIEFESKNSSERFVLFPEQIILIKSAGNYIEIIYRQKDKVSRRLIRNTLTIIEKSVSEYPFLIRCHRSSIVNIHSIQKVHKADDGLKLELFDYSREVNVSRQYVMKVKEALNQPAE